MKKLLTVLIISSAAVLCAWLVRFEFEFTQPTEHGNFVYKFRYRK
ncbi:hypothetical protein [Acutalibacter sp. 1XD8-33]|nr:hypothetical protein [Acutalibacter sp. 1XD8-33]